MSNDDFRQIGDLSAKELDRMVKRQRRLLKHTGMVVDGAALKDRPYRGAKVEKTGKKSGKR